MDVDSYKQRSQRFEQCRPQTSTECKVIVQTIRPSFQAEVRHYFWQKDLEPTPFEIDVCYLEMALNPRPESNVNYLNITRSDAFVSTGNCSFIPAKQKTFMQLSQGKQLVIGCMFEPEVFAPLVDWQWTPLELAACMNLRNMHINNALLQLSQELINPGYQSELWLDSVFNYLLVELSRHIREVRNHATTNQGKLSVHQLHLIETQINNQNGEYPQTSQLAELLGISSRHLARIFKATTGQTLSDYTAEARINHAKTQLLNSNKKVKEIAHYCGFESPSAFSQVFKRATGVTPKEYRVPKKRPNTDA